MLIFKHSDSNPELLDGRYIRLSNCLSIIGCNFFKQDYSKKTKVIIQWHL